MLLLVGFQIWITRLDYSIPITLKLWVLNIYLFIYLFLLFRVGVAGMFWVLYLLNKPKQAFELMVIKTPSRFSAWEQTLWFYRLQHVIQVLKQQCCAQTPVISTFDCCYKVIFLLRWVSFNLSDAHFDLTTPQNILPKDLRNHIKISLNVPFGQH